jgi:hypothetical protein
MPVVPLASLKRPDARSAKPEDLGLSLSEARPLLVALQTAVAQDQVRAYDNAKRNCPHCRRFGRIKDWRPRVFDTALGTINIRVPRVVACMCLPEPLDEDGDVAQYRETLCPSEKLLPARTVPELAYLCARTGAQVPYRIAAQHLRELCAIRGLSHVRVRRQTLKIGEHIDNVQFEAGWFAGARGHSSASRLGLAIDSTYVSGNAFEETSKIEVVAGRIERRGKMGRRFACVVLRRPFTRMLVAGALKQSGWHRRTRVDVVNDGAKGVRSLITDVAPRVAAPCSIGFISRPRRCSRRY